MYKNEYDYLSSKQYYKDKIAFEKNCLMNEAIYNIQNNYSLDLSSETDYFNYSDWQIIFDKLKFNKKIESLYLSNCNLYCQHAYLIAEMIKYNNKIDDLDLSNNFIRDEGAKVIIEALKVNNTLDTIWLNDNYISDKYMSFFDNYNKNK